ncbi:hypothetical protein CNR22_08500 [Sphingobacteriaceae bacterium]|nr:hypothetical protein CNR22_08500 [Sphingobacteriaceae bacterium]
MKKTAYLLALLFASSSLVSGNWNPSETVKSTNPFTANLGTASAPFENPKAFKSPATPSYKSKIGFEENKGQWPNQVQFKSDLGDGKRVFFEKNKFTYTLYNSEEIHQQHEDSHTKNKKQATTFKSHAFEMVFINSSLYTELQGSEVNDFHYNYYIGNDPSKWASNVSVYKKLTYKNLYEGIDLVAYEHENNFKYDYIVRAGAKAADIQLKFNSVNKLEIHGKNLSIFTSVGEVVESVPYAYQKIDGKEVAVACEYKLLRDGQTVVFSFPEGYDERYELIIDPVLVAATYSGSTTSNYGHCATYDNSGNIYTGGRAFGNGYPVTSGAAQSTFGGNTDICISKLNPTGTTLLYATYVGGTDADYPHSMFVNSNGELYVYGSTTSTNYPVSSGAYDNSFNGGSYDMVVTKFNSTGTSMLGSTYLGGSGDDGINLGATTNFNYGDNYRGEIIVGPAGDVFIAGTTTSTNFPVSSGAYDVTHNGNQDAVVIKMNSALTSLTWATYLGGTGEETGCSLRLSQAGDVYAVGLTEGGFPIVSGALTSTYQGGTSDGFIARLNSSGTSLVNSTYIGTGSTDIIYFLDIDVFGDIYIYGISQGTFPLSFGTYSNPNSLNFLQKINPALGSLIYSTMLGNGTKNNFSPTALMVDLCQNVYMAGWGSCTGYTVTTSAIQATTTGSGFHLMVLGPGASSCVYGTFFGPGGEHVDGGTSRFDPTGVVYQSICEGSASFPTTSNAYSPTKLSGGYDIAVFKIDFQLNCNPLFTNTIMCLGKTATISIVNVNTLLNPTYSIQPGGTVSSSPFFTVSPSTTTSYSVYVTGTNGFNAIVTNSGVSTVSIAPSPQVIPSVTQAVCSSTFNAFNLNLSWIPTASTPSYAIFWQPIPNAVSNVTQTSATGITPGVYNATITSLPWGCKTNTSFTINPIPTSVSFSLTGPTMINCFNSSVTRSASPATYSYTWLGLTGNYSGSSATFTLGQAGSWTVNATDPSTGCSGTQTFAITQDITPSTSTVTPLTQNITCSVTSIITVTATSNPSVNISHYWIAPSGGTLTMNNNPATFVPGFPGTYTHVTVNNINGCLVSKEFTVSSTAGFPTFNVTSPQNFTLGCSSKSLAVINIVNAQTAPTPGGSVSYTLLAPNATTNYITSIQVTYTVSVPGTYTVITKDNTNLCESRLQVSVLQNTIGPNISANVPLTRLTCYTPSVVLEGISTNTTPTSFVWSFPGNPGNVASNTIAVISNSVAVTTTLIANYTLTITDDNNSCKSTSVIAMEQNLFPPVPLISGASSITCNTPTLVLTNQSTSSIPAIFPHPLFVQGYTWDGPSPQEEQQLTTTYVAATPGTYTLIARDLNNGCFAVGTKTIDDFRDYPEVTRTVDPFILDCGDNARPIFPDVITQPGLTYSWTTVQGSTVSSTGSKTLSVNRSGQYSIVITNSLNGCSTSAVVEVISGSLQAAFVSDPITGYAPLAVTFTNTSFSSSTLTPNENITTYWNFGNATSASSVTQNVVGPVVYTQPGTYTTTMYARKGECLDSSMVRISVEIPSTLEIPNIFSPNGDGSNDLFFLRASNLSAIDIMITDRWGNAVYELKSSTGNVAWDGKNLYGKEAASGVYLYTLKATGTDGSKYDKKGTITLVR